jgi:hypothetical protein
MTLSTTSEIGLLSNPASSGKVYKINTIMVANRETNANAVTVTVNVYTGAALTGSGFPIAQAISVPGNASLIIIDKSTSFYLEENASITVSSGASNGISFLVSYEDIT